MARMTEAEKNGRDAEKNAYKALKKLNFPLRKGWPMMNLYAPTKGGGTTELDLVFVTKKGVFAIECKNLSGVFYGKETDHDWKNVKTYGRERNTEERTLYNPILQNRTHIDSLGKVLGEEVPIHSVILFSDKADYSNLQVSDRVLLLSLSEVKEKLLPMIRKLPEAMSGKEAKKVYKTLKKECRGGRKARKEHLELVQKIQEHPDVCPVCGKPLVMRNVKGKDGRERKFLGCTGYPSCKYTRNV